MAKKNVLILTGTGGDLGSGHLQRMLALAVHLNSTDHFQAEILLKENIFPPDESLKNIFTGTIPVNTDLIIRDMRDSSINEILHLKEKAPVLAIDDSGKGNAQADYKLTLLPLPSDENNPVIPDTDKFLYGYNFSKGIESLSGKNITAREFDVAVYAGYNPPENLISEIKNAIPASATSILLSGNKPVILTGRISHESKSYTEILCSTKIIVTHFGLTMFEAHICGCGIAALNPSPYHNTLTEIIKDKFNIIYSSEYSSFSPQLLHDILKTSLAISYEKNISINSILGLININLKNFTVYLEQITG